MVTKNIKSLMRTPWQKFRQQKHSWMSTKIMLFLFSLALFAPFLCNTRPLIIFYEGKCFFPIVQYCSEKNFGGEYDLEPDYQDQEFIKKIQEKNGWALWPLIPYSPDTPLKDIQDPPPAAPQEKAWLGTDDQGRDVATRLLYGLRTSLVFALSMAIGSAFLGSIAGALQGYFGGIVDLFFQRFIEIWAGLPMLFTIMILSSMIRPSPFVLLTIMILFSWTKLVGVVRAEFLRARHYTYVRAAEVLGVSSFRIMMRHIMPNVMGSALAFLPSLINMGISTLTALDFLGMGLPAGTASLGDLLHQAKSNLFAPWLGLSAFFSIALILILVNFIGEGLRNAFDPRIP